MNKSNMNILLNIKQGHLIRQLDAIIEGLTVTRNRLAEIPDKYCENDGEELKVIDENGSLQWKRCPKCREVFGIHKGKCLNMDGGNES